MVCTYTHSCATCSLIPQPTTPRSSLQSLGFHFKFMQRRGYVSVRDFYLSTLVPTQHISTPIINHLSTLVPSHL